MTIKKTKGQVPDETTWVDHLMWFLRRLFAQGRGGLDATESLENRDGTFDTFIDDIQAKDRANHQRWLKEKADRDRIKAIKARDRERLRGTLITQKISEQNWEDIKHIFPELEKHEEAGKHAYKTFEYLLHHPSLQSILESQNPRELWETERERDKLAMEDIIKKQEEAAALTDRDRYEPLSGFRTREWPDDYTDRVDLEKQERDLEDARRAEDARREAELHFVPGKGDGGGDTEADFQAPESQPSIPHGDDLEDRRGLVLPGHRYTGPGNSDDRGEPLGPVDELAREHDRGYADLIKEGINPYVKYNRHDKDFTDALAEGPGGQTWAGNFAQSLFHLKRKITEVLDPQAVRDADAQSKKARISQEKTVNEPGPVGAPPENASVAAGGGMSGDTEVDHSAGGSGGVAGSLWEGGAKFSANKVETCVSKTVCVLPYNNHQYDAIKSEGQNRGLSYFGYKTPWGYLDYNQMNVHFSPSEFQRLLENYDAIRPASICYSIKHLTIKDVNIATDSSTTITDSATGGLCIMEDTGYNLPYVIGNMQQTVPDALPGSLYYPPNYAYLTVNHRVSTLNNQRAFYVLEHGNFAILTTGAEQTFTYTFPELPMKSLNTHCQNPHQMNNPLYSYVLKKRTASGEWQNIAKDDYANKGSNFLPGPKMNSTADHTVYFRTGTEKRLLPPLNTVPWREARNSADGLTYLPGSKQPPADYNLELADGDQTDSLYYEKTASNTQGKNYSVTLIPTLPSMVWDTRSLYYEQQIWAKIPDMDKSFMPEPLFGGWGMHNPPPQILLKVYPMPAYNTTATAGKSYLKQYATFILTVKMTWDVKPRSDHLRWNPQPAVQPPTFKGTSVCYTMDTNGSSSYYVEPDRGWTTRFRVKNL
ncbi:unnamed protein product [Artibeus jamaicensis parvovirus 1]|uniref:Capsid protein VP1 n=1 Tax=Artibeus jamaicensis parvovirus TaxID=2849740 RepID=H2ESE9_9VIRU|nr:unnamed protein product [Artibeus jamaicensis parvovirus 1]AEX38016.1 putative capsid protein VP1 [Artibeus jamaicensis parvovirus 1]